MATNYGRVCKLEIEEQSYSIDLSELRIQFEISKSSIGVPNTARILVYNISENTRGRLFNSGQKVRLTAGYNDDSGTIFSGDIQNIFHRREQPDFVTEIYAKEGRNETFNAFTNTSYGSNVSLMKILDGLRDDLGLEIGEYSFLSDAKLINGWTYCGKTSDALNSLGKSYGFAWSIQSERLYVTASESALNKQKRIISAQSGMIGSPVVTEKGADVKTLLLWDMIPNQSVQIVSDSKIVKYQNLSFDKNIKDRVTRGEGNYIVRGIIHSGDTRGQDWYTIMEGFNYEGI